MSYNEFDVHGYGFNISDVKWSLKKLAPFCEDLKDAEEGDSLADYLFSTSQFSEVFESVFDECDWAHYEESDSAGYILVNEGRPWDIPDDAPKTAYDAKVRFWEIISQYVADGYTFKDFETAVEEIEDCLCG